MSIVKRVSGVIVGFIVASAIVMAGDYCAGLSAPSLKTIDLSDKESAAAIMAMVPLQVFLIMLVGYIIGAFAGGLVASLITGRQASRPAIIVGILLTIGGLFNLWEVPHSLWFAIVSTLVYIPLAWSGWRVVATKASA